MKTLPTLSRVQQEALAEYMIGTPINAGNYSTTLNHHRWGYHRKSRLDWGYQTCPACIYKAQHAA